MNTEMDLDDLAHGFAGRSFHDFVSFARAAQARDGYIPSPVPMGSSQVHRAAAERFAAALEAAGLRVGRVALCREGAR